MRTALVLASVVLLGGVASARGDRVVDPVGKKVEEARFLLKQKEHEKAVLLLADAIALAQKRGALVPEQGAVDALDEAFGGLTVESVRPGSTDPVRFGKRSALAAAMAKLDPKRRSAFASAPSMAHALLLYATETGDGKFAAEAAAVLEAQPATPKAGRAARALAVYAAGMRQVGAEADAKATPLLEDALALGVEDDWQDLVVPVATELAAAWLRLDDPVRAKDALARATRVVGGRPDDGILRHWSVLVQARLAGAPAEVRAALPAAISGESGSAAAGGAPGGAGGAGGKGGSGGGVDVSKVGEALADHPKSKPLVTVERGKQKWSIRQGFDPKFQATFPFAYEVAYFEDGGVTLAFHREAVGLYMIDPEGLRGQPGEGGSRSPARAFYLLGVGETYGVTKDGRVTIE